MKAHELEKLNEICSARNLAIIADEVFLDFALHADQPSFSFAHNSAALTFTMSGLSKISGLPQMKAAWLVTGGPDPLRSQLSAPGNHRGHLSFDERAGSARYPRAARRAPSVSKAISGTCPKKSGGTRSSARNAEILRAAGSGSRLVRCAARPGDTFRRRTGHRSIGTKEYLRSSGPFLRFSVGGILDRKPDHARRGICGRNETAVVVALAFKKTASEPSLNATVPADPPSPESQSSTPARSFPASWMAPVAECQFRD